MMGKLPGWMIIENQEIKDGRLVLDIRIRRWHPGFWLMYWKSAIRTSNEIGIPFYIWFPVALKRFVMPRLYEGTIDE